MGRKKKKVIDQLTQFELKVMSALWSLRSGTVHEIQQKMNAGNDYAYTTISTVLRNLESKKIVQSFKNGRSHIYAPSISLEEYFTQTVTQITHELFEGDVTAFWSCLLDTKLRPDMRAEEILQRLSE